MKNNIILLTDSYKQTHHRMYDPDIEYVYSYFEARDGATFNNTAFFGLQAIIKKYLEGVVVTQEMLDQAENVCRVHFGQEIMNKEGWQYIIDIHNGKLPISIKAVPEGMWIPKSNVLMTVVNTDPRVPWITNFVETLLTHVWYPSTIATKSFTLKKYIMDQYRKNHDEKECEFFRSVVLPYLVHDFGMRGVSSMESAGMGGMAHLTSFKGTDTMNSMLTAMEFYDADLEQLANSVPASEHSVATAGGEEKELDYLKRMITQFPNGIVSVVADSYNITRFVSEYMKACKSLILNRWKNGDPNMLNRIVVRPDSPRFKGDTPVDQIEWILDELWDIFGGEVKSNGLRALHPAVGVIYGDGLSFDEIIEIYGKISDRYDISSVVVGQGGGLLQKLNRDTQRFAFKCAAVKRAGQDDWQPVSKNPLDTSKKSKSGILKLVSTPNGLTTVNTDQHGDDIMQEVFRDGELLRNDDFEMIRKRLDAII